MQWSTQTVATVTFDLHLERLLVPACADIARDEHWNLHFLKINNLHIYYISSQSGHQDCRTFLREEI
jgi:hypothetical protein